MDYQRNLGLVVILLGLCLEALLILVIKNPLAGLVGLAVVYIGWRVRWAQ